MGTTKIESPQPPETPTVAQSMSDYVNNYPALFQMQQQYAPQEAAMNVSLAQQYAQPMGQALKDAQDAMYPNETAITEKASQQALAGMDSEVPDWMKEQYQSDMNANLGTNAGSPMGANYVSTALLQQQNDWQKYYTNLGLSISGKQPVYGATQPGYTNQLSGYTPQGVMNYNAQNYGNYSSAYSNMYGVNAQYLPKSALENANTQLSQTGQLIGNIGKIGGSVMGMFKSSMRYKNTIKLWAKH